MSLPFALGEVFVSFAAMALPEWRDLELVMGLTGLLGAAIWLVLPESPRWLIAKVGEGVGDLLGPAGQGQAGVGEGGAGEWRGALPPLAEVRWRKG